jgi:hypothetical protein
MKWDGALRVCLTTRRWESPVVARAASWASGHVSV